MIQGFAGLHAPQGAGLAQGGLPSCTWSASSNEGRATHRRQYHALHQGQCTMAAASSTHSAAAASQVHHQPGQARRKWHRPSFQVELLDNPTSSPQLPPAHHQLEQLLDVATPVSPLDHLPLPRPVNDDLELQYSLLQNTGDQPSGQVHAVLQPPLPAAEAHASPSGQQQQQQQQAADQQGEVAGQPSLTHLARRGPSSGANQHSRQYSNRGGQHTDASKDRQAQQQQVAWASPGLHPAMLTSKLSRCRTFTALQQAYAEHKDAFNHLHVACALNRLAKCPASDSQAEAAKQMLCNLEQMFIQHLPQYSAREVANAMWVWAKLSHQPSDKTRAVVVATITAGRAALLKGRHVAPQALCNLAYALATLRWQEPQVWAAVTDVVLFCLKRHQRLHSTQATQTQDSSISGRTQLWPQNAQPATSTATGSQPPEQPGATRRRYHNDTTLWSPMDCASIAWSFASAKQYSPELFDVLAACLEEQLQDLYPIDLSNALWACASVHHPAPHLFQAATPITLECMAGFSEQGLANLAWAYAMAGVEDNRVIVAVCREAASRLHKFLPMHLVQLTWAMARTKQVHQPIVTAALADMQAHPQRWSTRNASLLLYSAALCGMLDEVQLSLVQPMLIQRLKADCAVLDDLSNSSNDHEVSRSATSSRVSSQGAPRWSQEHQRAPAIVFQNASQIVWAYAHTGVYNLELYDTAVQLCLSHVGGWLGSPASFQTLLWSFGYARHYHPSLFHIAAQHVAYGQPWQEGMTPSQLAGVLVALAGMQHYDQEACSVAAAHFTQVCQRNVDAVNTETLANVAWALAMLDHLEPELLQVLLPVLVARWHMQAPCKQGDTEEYHGRSHTWRMQASSRQGDTEEYHGLSEQPQSVSCAEQPHSVLFTEQPHTVSTTGSRLVGVQQLEHRKESQALQALHGDTAPSSWQAPRRDHELSNKHMGQLFQIFLWLQDMASQSSTRASDTSRALLQLLPEDLIAAARELWVQQARKECTVSASQLQVYRALSSLGLQVQLETTSHDHLFSIDCLVRIGGHKVAVELNGPEHYAASDPQRMLGSKALRDRLLTNRGYQLLNLPYWEWDATQQDVLAAQQYLWQKLEQLLGSETMVQLKQKSSSAHQIGCISNAELC